MNVHNMKITESKPQDFKEAFARQAELYNQHIESKFNPTRQHSVQGAHNFQSVKSSQNQGSFTL